MDVETNAEINCQIDNGNLQKIASLSEQIQKLENEKKHMQEEFNIQRAKMKELFLQKEEELKRATNEHVQLSEEIKNVKMELDEARSQLVVADLQLESNLEVEKRKAQEEIATLQQLLQETVEESSSSRTLCDSKLKKLEELTEHLQNENEELRSLTHHSSPHHASESGSLAPSVMLSAVTKTLARKLGADSYSAQDNLEESMRKAQEDAEVLRSLVVPLEEEISALKDKLRTTDEQLQKCRLCGHLEHAEVMSRLSAETSPINDTLKLPVPSNDKNQIAGSASQGDAINRSESTQEKISEHSREKASPTPCDMCNNYEAELVREQQRSSELQNKLSSVEKLLERQKEDLMKEISFRMDVEEKWNEKKEEYKEQVAELNKKTLCAEQDLQELRKTYEQTYTSVSDQLMTLTRERELVQKHLDQIQKENDNLVGKHSLHSQSLQSEIINLPDKVEELQEKLLQNHESLISATIAKEVAQESEETLRCEIQLLRDQMVVEQQKGQEEITALKTLLHRYEKERPIYMSFKEKLETAETSHREAVGELKSQLKESIRVQKQMELINNDLRSRVTSLQQELDNSEHVQKDFVRLSQSLQVELEKIRDSDMQVRWQYEEDVNDCSSCKVPFSSGKKKLHCRHCGQIFCIQCLSHVVLSGPNQRESKVCGVCHTLLVHDTAPYFSTEAPHSPD